MTESRAPQTSYSKIYAVAVLIVAIGLSVVNWGSKFTVFQDPSSHEKKLAYVDSMQAPEKKTPSLVIFGTSRPAFGLEAKTLAVALGYPSNAAVNLAFPGLGISQIAAQLKNHYAELTAAKTWVIGIDDYLLLAPISKNKNTSLTIKERLENLINPLMQPILHFNALGLQLRQNLKEALSWSQKIRIDVWIPTNAGAWSYEGLNNRIADVKKDSAIFKEITDNYFKNKEFCKKHLSSLREILSIARKHNIKVILLDLPSHPYYHQIVAKHYSVLAAQNLEASRKLAEEYDAKFISCASQPGNCGVDESHFGDPVHLNKEGTKAFTLYLSQFLNNL